MIRAILFDWGDTLMRDDPNQLGPMSVWPNVTALPDALETLQWAKNIGLVCVASNARNSGAAEIRTALARVNLGSSIDRIFCRCELGYTKTDPLFWRTIANSLSLLPRQIVMVGDNYDSDVVAPMAAGFHSVWFNEKSLPPKPCLAIASLKELPLVVSRLC